MVKGGAGTYSPSLFLTELTSNFFREVNEKIPNDHTGHVE